MCRYRRAVWDGARSLLQLKMVSALRAEIARCELATRIAMHSAALAMGRCPGAA